MDLPDVTLPGPPVAHALPAGATLGPRRLSDYEFVWMLSGYARVSLDHHSHVLRPGFLQLARAGMVDRYEWCGHRPSHAYVHFTLDDRGRLAPPAAWPLIRPAPPNGALSGLLTDLIHLRSRSQLGAAAEVVGILLDRFVAEEQFKAGPVHDNSFRSAVSDVLQQAWSGRRLRQLPVAEFAARLMLSRSQTTRLTTEVFGVAPRMLMELLRLCQAAHLLRRSNTPIAEIARTCGFAEQFYFAKRFRLAYGITATQFRRSTTELPDAPLAQHSAALAELGRQMISW